MRTLLVLALALGAAQDDFARAVEHLGSDDVSERDRAARDLERLGTAALERLETARDSATDLEVKGRLAHIVRSIRKREEFAKVFGETRRVSLRAKARRADDVAAELGKALDERIVLDGLDPARPLDLSLENATLWEALDALAGASGARYEYGSGEVVLRPGRSDRFPVHYAQQFRVGISETQRLDYRSPSASGEILLFTLELAYQRNMKPLTDTSRDRIHVDSVKDAKGNDALAAGPDWGNSLSTSGIAHGVVHSFFARADATAPLTVTGGTAVPFAYETKEIRLAIEGDGKSLREEEVSLDISAFSQTGAGLSISLRGQSADGSEVRGRLGRADVCLVDAEGRKHPLAVRGGSGSTGQWVWNFETTTKVEKPQAIVLPWITKFHWVEIPFLFEGVRVPPP